MKTNFFNTETVDVTNFFKFMAHPAGIFAHFAFAESAVFWRLARVLEGKYLSSKGTLARIDERTVTVILDGWDEMDNGLVEDYIQAAAHLVMMGPKAHADMGNPSGLLGLNSEAKALGLQFINRPVTEDEYTEVANEFCKELIKYISLAYRKRDVIAEEMYFQLASASEEICKKRV